jgi:hypothetical protein
MANVIIDAGYVHSACRVRTMDNTVISTGRITEINDNYVVIRNIPELRNVIPYNKRVKLTILNDKLGYRTLIATVYASTTKVLKLYDTKEADEFERREYYRINVSLKGEVLPLNINAWQGSNEDEKSGDKIQVRIENISLSGVLFTGPCLLKLDDRLSIDIHTPNGMLTLVAIVRRIVKDRNGGDSHYGCEFLPYPDKIEDALWKYMMQKELEDIRRVKGEWSIHDQKF